jgi:hypothetical protein
LAKLRVIVAGMIFGPLSQAWYSICRKVLTRPGEFDLPRPASRPLPNGIEDGTDQREHLILGFRVNRPVPLIEGNHDRNAIRFYRDVAGNIDSRFNRRPVLLASAGISRV